MEHVFIINPVSGKKDMGAAMAQSIEAAAERCGIKVAVLFTKAPRHATQLARSYGEAGGPVRLYSVGGDGTLNEVLEGAYPYPGAEVGCLPYGSGNDFVRSFGRAEDFHNIEEQIKGKPLVMDLMQTDTGICAAITSTGLDAEVAYNIPKYRRVPLLGGSMAYNLSILEKLLKPLGKQLSITIDGEKIEGKFLIAAVCNARHYGGGYCAAPVADLSDGWMDVIFVKKVSRLLIASIIGNYKKGNHFEGGEIIPKYRDIMKYYRAKEVVIEPTGSEQFILNVDGECGPAARLYAKIMPGAARFILPAKLAAENGL